MCAMQLGTLGAGNHYAEMQVVDEIFDPAAAAKMGISKIGQVRLRSGVGQVVHAGAALTIK